MASISYCDRCGEKVKYPLAVQVDFSYEDRWCRELCGACYKDLEIWFKTPLHAVPRRKTFLERLFGM